MALYKIKNFYGRYLNINGNKITSLSDNQNVTLWAGDDVAEQRWEISSLGSAVTVKSDVDRSFALNYYWGNGQYNPGDCDVYPWSNNSMDSQVNFIQDGIYHRIKLTNYNLYLTAAGDYNGAEVTWEPLGTTAASRKYQQWNCEMQNYITLGGWLKMYTSPTSTKQGRNVYIPSVNGFTAGGHSYQFTNENYWYSYENPYTTQGYINPYATTQIRSVKGSDPVIKIGSFGDYTDEDGNYWMAVGPKVVNPQHGSSDSITAAEMYGHGKLDVVVKDSNNNRYYIPAVVGDAKNHTWDNGVIQTFKAYPNGAFTSAGANFNGQVCAEFIGALSGRFSGFGEYKIDKIIFYED